MTTLLKPAQLAELLGVSEPTIKRWCLRLSEFLSEHANPAHGSQRRLTEQDVFVLRHVKALLDTGLSLEAIAVQLRKEAGETPTELSTVAASPLESNDPWAVLRDALAQIASQNERIATLETRLERLSHEVEALKIGGRQ